MTEKERFVDKGIITIVDQGLTDTLTDKDYWVEDGFEDIVELLNSLHKENEELKQVNKKILDTINNKITEKGIDWYKAEDNSKEEKEANLQLNILEEVRDELREKELRE